ncbi:uncharacterized protein BDW43DRAFT_306554 [Aspergillus alliaceus]|uniref:uncharacterized protein n=1 Tax=Petromyces alliaceus TaxID=209559 RepID=UPI0012A419E6|nr:uncharacterized protein BDW43DRAFT_306554 [Aspergillus alliaceus]KAB8238708.1 hypothetical protein BDW43DRAFT_306554 [Aspergillus alliaceus]
MKLSTIFIVATSVLLTGAGAAPRHSTDTCWKSCFPHKRQCPHGWHPEKHRHCWTCCKDHDGNFEYDYDYDYEYEYELFDWQ